MNRRPPPTCFSPTRNDDRTLGVVPVSTTWTTSAGKACVIRVKLPRTHDWKRVDRNGNYITTERVLYKALRGIMPDKVKRDSALRNFHLSEESYPETTDKVSEKAMSKLAEYYELVLQLLHRDNDHIPVARLRELLEYYLEGEVIQ